LDAGLPGFWFEVVFFLNFKWIHTDCKTAQGTPLAAAEWKKQIHTEPQRSAQQGPTQSRCSLPASRLFGPRALQPAEVGTVRFIPPGEHHGDYPLVKITKTLKIAQSK